jgi:hypothetical protein
MVSLAKIPIIERNSISRLTIDSLYLFDINPSYNIKKIEIEIKYGYSTNEHLPGFSSEQR